MKTNLILTILTAVIVIALNFPGHVNDILSPAQITAGTMAAFFILIAYQLYSVFSGKKSETVIPVFHSGQETDNAGQGITRLPHYVPGLHVDELLESLFDAYEALPGDQIKPDEAEKKRLTDELDTFRQSYLWCLNMQKIYGQKWLDTFQGADLPLSPDSYPVMRSLIAEIALQTADFCRYRTGDINLKERMIVNPRIVLLGCPATEAGARPLSDNPFETPKEVHALHALFKHDGIKLRHASIHGFIEPTNE